MKNNGKLTSTCSVLQEGEGAYYHILNRVRTKDDPVSRKRSSYQEKYYGK